VNVRRLAGTHAYPRRVIFASLVLPVLLLAGLIALDFWVLEPSLPPVLSHIALFAIGAAGAVTYSIAILGRLGDLHQGELAQSRRLRALNEAGLALSAELETEALFRKLAELAAVVGNARFAALGTFDEHGVVTRFYTAGINEDERALIGHLPVGKGILGLLPRSGRPIRLRDLHEHPASVGFPANHPSMKSFLGVPIRWRGESVGNLYLTEKRGAAEFSPEDEEALLALAAQAAIAIENARLYAQTSRISALEERHRDPVALRPRAPDRRCHRPDQGRAGAGSGGARTRRRPPQRRHRRSAGLRSRPAADPRVRSAPLEVIAHIGAADRRQRAARCGSAHRSGGRVRPGAR